MSVIVRHVIKYVYLRQFFDNMSSYTLVYVHLVVNDVTRNLPELQTYIDMS